MKKILLVCSAGMSTSLLVTKMKEAAKQMGEEIEAKFIEDIQRTMNDINTKLKKAKEERYYYLI